MPDKSNNPFQFWQELKRRKVVRVITVYAAAAFVILELVSIIVEPLRLPDWTLPLVIVLLSIGFLISVFLSWVYDITPEGIQKTRPVTQINSEEKKSSPKEWKVATYVSVLIIIAFVVFYIAGNNNKSSDISKLDKSIAVLPFENWSVGEENSHLGNAIANEIITELFKIKGFHVISYTSSSQYKGPDKPSVPLIGKELGVNFIIEGTIERQNEDVSIHVQVIQAENDDHIWANEFFGEWKDIFKIQDDIALKVADKLKMVLSENEMEHIEKKPTDNMEAYNYFLRGNDFHSRSLSERDWRIAINMYQKAIELDSNFALAYTKLAAVQLELYFYHYDRTIDRLIKSREVIDAAFNIDPDLIDAHIASGLYYYWGFLDYSKALKEFETALRYMPNNTQCLFYIGLVHRRMGNWQKAEEGFINALNNDPRSHKFAFVTAETYFLLGEYSKALNYYNLAIKFSPDFISAYLQKIELFLKWEGNTKKARETFEEASLTINLSSSPKLIRLYVLEGRYQDAIDFLNTTNFEVVQSQFYYYPKSLFYAMIYDLLLDTEKAKHHYNLSRIAIEARVLDYPDDSRLYSSLGICYAGLGQKEQALKVGKKAVELLPISKEAYRGVYRLGDLARIYVMVEEYESALEQLDLLLSIPGILSTKLLQLDPIWKPLWNHSEFIQLMEKYSESLDK